jgi:hypothetical protein
MLSLTGGSSWNPFSFRHHFPDPLQAFRLSSQHQSQTNEYEGYT